MKVHTRTGQRPRWSFFHGPEHTAFLGVLFLLTVLLGCLVPLGASFWVGWQGSQALAAMLDPHDPLHALRRASPLDGEDPGRGYFSGTIEASRSGAPALCLVAHGFRGSRSSFVEDHPRKTFAADEGTWLRLADGRVLRLLGPVAFVPEELHEAVHAKNLHKPLSDMPEGDLLREQCILGGDRVFVEGCVASLPGGGDALSGCGGEPALITPGDGTPARRIHERFAALSSELFGFSVACLLMLAYGWQLVRARPLAKSLARWSGFEPRNSNWAGDEPPVIAFLLVVVGFIRLWMDAFFGRSWPLSVHGTTSLALCAIALLFGVSAHERRRELRAARDLLRAAPLSPLGRASGALVKVAAKVKRDAEPVEGPLTGKPRAFSRVEIQHIHTVPSGDGRSRAVKSRLERRHAAPELVAIEDASGEGLLSMEGAELDLRAVRSLLKPQKDSPRPGVLKYVAHADPSSRYEVEESYLEPEEALLVVGEVKQREASTRAASYRESAGTPLLGGRGDAPLIVHAGTEASLLRGLHLEMRYLEAAGIAVLLTVGVFIGVQLYCW